MLKNSDARRGLRAVIAAFVTIALIVLIYWIVELMRAYPAVLEPIAKGALIIVGLAMIGYIAENGIRAMKFTLPGGASAEMQSDAPAAAQAVADVASDTAAEISDGRAA